MDGVRLFARTDVGNQLVERIVHTVMGRDDVYPNMDDTALQNELARLIFLSDLVGRIEVVQELKS
ncbi:hypothetical protein LST1_24060 [Neisseria elongata]|nr:hypothetical protein LST1_24060 [Neisseria elongata]